MKRGSQKKNDFRFDHNPFAIGIAGDSAAGKDTLVKALQGLFGHMSVTTLSGDNYHLWDRKNPMWKVITHLNPMANDLEKLANDLMTLIDRKTIHIRPYNHEDGRKGPSLKIKSNDIIIVSGLHSLYLPILRQCYNLSIYMDTDEELRKYFKMERDMCKRGYSQEQILSSMKKRRPDAKQFIKPQSHYADIVFSMVPTDPLKKGRPLNLGLKVYSRLSLLKKVSLKHVLAKICGLYVKDIIPNDHSFETQLIIEGKVFAKDIALAMRMLCPDIFKFLDINPRWSAGITGPMQLITLFHVNQVLTQRGFFQSP